VHFPEDMLHRIDAVSRRRGISRNRFVIQACEEALNSDAGEWPEDLFSPELSVEERTLLEEASAELEQAVLRSRRNRGASLL
jgi:hypothetical protein